MGLWKPGTVLVWTNQKVALRCRNAMYGDSKNKSKPCRDMKCLTHDFCDITANNHFFTPRNHMPTAWCGHDQGGGGENALMHKLGSCIQQHNSSIYSSSVVQRKTYAHLYSFEKWRRNSPINCASENNHWHGSVKFTQRWSSQPPLARNLRPSLQVRWHACIPITLFCSAFLSGTR